MSLERQNQAGDTVGHSNFRYAILGTGALGGLYGGLLARQGSEVHFLLRSDFEHVSEHGLKIETPLGDFGIAQPNIYRCPKDLPKVDVVIVAWKTTSGDDLADALAAACDETTIVLVLQNGLGVERAAADIVGEQRVLGGCCFLCSNKVGPGHIKHLDYGRIAFGEYARSLEGSVSPRMEKIADDFRAAGVDMTPSNNLREVRWKKLVWNIPFNGLSVALEADTHSIVTDPAARELAESLMRDVQQAAAACGVKIEDAHVEKMLVDTEKMVPYDSSMRLDYLAKRPIEVEAIFGEPLRQAIAHGFVPTRIEMLYRQLVFLDRRNRGVL